MNATRQAEIIAAIQKNRERFFNYNQRKLMSLYSSFSTPNMVEIFEAIPLLISMNQQDIPGYVEWPTMVTGIYNYKPSQRALNFLKSKFPSFSMQPAQGKKPFIQMLALMGSAGTIAYTKQSDFDYWICADESETDPETIRQLKLKCRKIENWLDEKFNIETHFFLNDINKVKKNIFDEDSEEDLAGTSLGELLKEEFFRSSIVVAGKMPFWWVVPADSDDAAYTEWLSALDGSYLKEDFVDLGNLDSIEQEDFLIAALFQLLKSLGNPFKSVIKLGLLERYIFTSGGSPFISNIIKRNMQRGMIDTPNIDSYLIMFNDVYDYYSTLMRDDTATEMLKICFYLKVDPQLSRHTAKPDNGDVPEKIKIMQEFIEQWRWQDDIIHQMDNFENLDIDSVNKLWIDIKKFILNGYRQILVNIESKKTMHKLSGEEMKGITRKIYSHFSLADNKIDNTLSFKSYPPEKLLTIEFVRGKDGREFWILSKRAIIDNYPTKVIIHKENSLLALIVWTSLNRLFLKDFTRLEIDPGIHAGDPNFLRDLIAELTLHFLYKRVDLHNRYFLREPFPIISFIIINPFTKYAKKIDELYFLYHNSWGETRFEKFRSEADIAAIAAKVLSGAMATGLDFENTVRVVASPPYSSSRELDRIVSFFKDAFSFFIEERSNAKKRYVTMLGNQYAVFSTKKTEDGDTVAVSLLESEAKMLYSLSYNTGVMNMTRIDPTVPELAHLKIIFDNYNNAMLQIYFQREIKYCYFYVSDERGSLVFFRKNSDAFVEYLSRLYVFAQNAVRDATGNNQQNILATQLKQIAIYNIDRDIRNNCSIVEINPELNRSIQDTIRTMVPLNLSLHIVSNREIGFSMTLPDGATTPVFTKAQIPRIAAQIIEARRRGRGYSYFVTSIDMSHIGPRLYKNYTSFYFTQKNLFEMLVENALRKT